ncbi:MAG: energy transducer TonB [Thermoanaerobaculia bacterium]
MPRPLKICLLLLLGLAAHAALAQKVPKPATDEPYRVGGGVTRPELLSQGARPVYTETARRARVQGVVILEAVIDEQGDVTNVRVLKGLPMGLDQSAIDAIKTWKFKPATFEGRPVKVYYVLTVNFHVDGPAYQGPAFLTFLREHADYAELLSGKRFAEAAAFLDRLPADPDYPEIGLARIYLLLDQDLLENAWQAARAYEGIYRNEALRAVASYGIARVQRNELDSSLRSDALEVALQVVNQGLGEEPDDVDWMLLKSALLRQQAAQMSDDNEDAPKLRAEAARLEARVAEEKARRGAERAKATGEREPLLVQDDVTKPEKISGEPAVSTDLALRARVWGNVTVGVVIDARGDVIDARVVKGLPMGLDQKALEAVRTWKFKPATLKGQPVKVYYLVTVNFPEPKASAG